jgi:hypothetical protein
MTTGEGADDGGGARDDKAKEERDRDQRGQRINVGPGDDNLARIQLAARWAEFYGPRTDSLGSILKRFRAAYEYLDAVTHGVEPPNVDHELVDSRPIAQPAGAAPEAYTPPTEAPSPPPPTPPPAPAPQPEPRPWG